MDPCRKKNWGGQLDGKGKAVSSWAPKGRPPRKDWRTAANPPSSMLRKTTRRKDARKRYATAAEPAENLGRFLKHKPIWDTATGQPLTAPLRHPYTVRGVAFGPDLGPVVIAAWPALAFWLFSPRAGDLPTPAPPDPQTDGYGDRRQDERRGLGDAINQERVDREISRNRGRIADPEDDRGNLRFRVQDTDENRRAVFERRRKPILCERSQTVRPRKSRDGSRERPGIVQLNLRASSADRRCKPNR